jgi:beta-propeller repeat-containing protein
VNGARPFDAGPCSKQFQRRCTLVKIALQHIFRHNVKPTLVLFYLITIAAYAEPPRWVRAISSQASGDSCVPTQCDDVSYAVKVGPDDQKFILGSFSGTARFAHTTLVSAGGLDVFLASYGRSGELLWIVQAGGPGNDNGQGMALDRAGNIYVTGQFTDTATFGSTNGATQTATGIGSTMFLAKYRPSGVLVWVQTGVAPYAQQSSSEGVAVDPASGTVYISGFSQDEVIFSSANGTVNTVPGVGTWHMVLAKYDTRGNFEWGQTNQANPNSISYGVAVDAEDNAYVTGWIEDTTTFTSSDGNNLTVTGFSPAQTSGDYPDDVFLVKYDRHGNAKWVNHIGGYVGRGSAVAVSPNGEVTIVGQIGNIDFGSPGEAETIATSQPPGTSVNLGGGDFTNPFNLDAFVATYDSAGVLRRVLRKGDSNQQAATGLTYDHKGDLYVTGVFQGTNDPQNLFVLKFSGRKLLWTKVAENAGVFVLHNTEVSPAVSVDSDGRVFVTGGYQGTARFGRIRLHGTGAADIFLAELAPED